MRKKCLNILLILLCSFPIGEGWGGVFAQCCSPGNPVGGTNSLSILAKNKLRFIGFYRFGYSDTYFQGTKPSGFSLVKDASYNFAGVILSYGITGKFNIESELGYFVNRTQNYNLIPSYTLQGYGLSNAVISLKYNLIRNTEKEFEWTLSSGGKIPFTQHLQVIDNVELPIDVQPSTNAFGMVAQSFLYKGYVYSGLHFFLLNRFETNFENIKGYRFGNACLSSLFISKTITPVWTGILQIRNEIRENDHKAGTEIASSGGAMLFLAPQINCNIAQWNISVLADMPVYRNYNGTQLANKYALSLSIIRDFDLSRKAKPILQTQ